MFLLWKDRSVFTILSISSNVPKVKEILFNKYWLRTYHKSGTAHGLCKEEVFVRWIRQFPLLSFPLTTSNYKHIMLRELRSIEYPAQWFSKFVPPTTSISITGGGGTCWKCTFSGSPTFYHRINIWPWVNDSMFLCLSFSTIKWEHNIFPTF